MFVDTNDGARAKARGILEREGFKVLTARNSVEALVLAADYPLAIDVLITDGGMRVHQNGLELAACFGILRPETRVVIACAPGEDEAEGDWERLAMPFDKPGLVRAAMRALEPDPVRAAA